MEANSLNRVVLSYLGLSLVLAAVGLWRISDQVFIDQPAVPLNLKTNKAPIGRLIQESTEHVSYRSSYVSPSRSPNQRTDAVMLRTFEQAIGDSWKSTVQVFSDRKQLALGLIVHKDGWIITKASQIVGKEVTVRLYNGIKLEAKLKQLNNDIDLALLQVDEKELPTVVWHPENLMHTGGWLATTTTSRTPLAIGVVSVGPRAIPSARAVLGVSLGDANEGALVSMVVPGGGADRAGVEEGDVIVSIDGQLMSSKNDLLHKIGTLRAGQRVAVGITREKSAITLEAQLMDLSANLFDPTEMEVNGQVSARATGFSRAFQHDSVLAPHQCGGPLIDSRGRIVGVNIARAGRVNSYALPVDVVLPAVNHMIASALSTP